MVWPFDNELTPSVPGLLDGISSYQRPEELNKLLGTDLDRNARSLAKGIDRDLRKVHNSGLDVSLTEPRSNFFMDVLDTLDAPRQGIAGIIDSALRGDIFTPEVGTGWRRGQTENITTSDILRRHDIIDNPILRGIAGFAGDVATDPLTYLTFGTGTAAKVGGRAVTDAGLALKNQAVERLAGLGITDTLEQSKVLDEVFRGVARGQDALKNLRASDATDAVRALEAKRLEDARDVYSSLFRDDEVLNADLFKKARLNVGANIPFLGHLQEGNGAVEELKNAPGVVGQTLRAIGKVIKPGRADLFDLELSDDAVNAFRNINEYANGKLADLGTSLAALPVIGKTLGNTGEKVADFFTAANNTFQKAFYRKGIVGATNDQIFEEYQNAVSGIKTIARDRALQTIGIDGLKNQDDLKDAWLLIDELGSAAASRGNIAPEQAEAIMRKMALGRDLHDGDLSMLRDGFNTPLDELGNTPESLFRNELTAKLADPNIKDSTKLMVTKLMSGFDELALQEADQGIKHGFLEYYVTHKYKDLDRNPFSKGASGKANQFTEGRKYRTLSDAFEQGGKVADIDVPKLLEWRIGKSLTLQAQRNFAHRLMLENSLPEHIVKSLYQEALFDPNGAAAKTLKRGRWDYQPVDLAQLAEGSNISERAKLLGKDAAKRTPEENQLLQMSHADFNDYMHKTMWSNGYRPKDGMLPDAILGEIGKEIDIPGGGKMYLPTQVADAYKETVAARDLFKEKFGNTAIGRALVNGADTATGFFKKFVTVPFPAYWAQNFMGDRFRQVMGGLNAMDPGVQARTYSLLAGNSVVKNKAGQMLDRSTIERIIKENGMNYSVSDYLGALESFGDMNIDKFIRTGKGKLDNLVSSEKGSKAALVAQVHDKFQKSFDGFFRVSEMVRRFEQGDNLPDAVRAANEMYFNYRNMTPVEASYFRRFYMFYGYMSKATRATFTDLVSNPGNLTLQLHGTRGLAELFSDPDAAPTADAADLRLLASSATNEQLSHIVGKTPDGKPIFGRGFAAPLNAVMQQFSVQTPRNFTVGEITDAALSSIKRTVQKQFASANPAINAAAQQISGKNLYFDKPLDAEFLRKLPSLNAAIEKIAGLKYNELPIDLDAPAKAFLNAVPDGKGRLIADPGKMWILMNLIPGLSRATSMAGTFTNADIPTKAAILRTTMGVNLQDTDLSRTYLQTQREELDHFMRNNSVKQRLKNMEESGS